MKDVMIDIETMGGIPNGAIASIGACVWDAVTSQVTDPFYVNVDVDDAVARGMMRDDRTVAWWAKQPQDARDALRDPEPIELTAALWQLIDWMPKKCCVWAKPPSFDITILRTAFNLCYLRCPWHFRQERDMRTLLQITRDYTGGVELSKHGDKHNALHDAQRQGIDAVKCIRALRLNSIRRGGDG